MTVLLLSEHDNSELNPATARALSAALEMSGPVDVLVMGTGCANVAAEAARLKFVRRVVVADDEVLRHFPAEHIAATLHALSPGYDAIVAPTSASARSALPRLAAKLGVMQLSDVVAVDDPRTFRRPIYAGNAVETVHCATGPIVMTVRSAAFAPTGFDSSPVEVENVAPVIAERAASVLETRTAVSARPDLGTARVVVSGGRALGSREQFEALLFPLADRLCAAIGASRAAVDSGYAGNELQVGQTGKIVAPDLYLAIGISGAVQHLAGIGGARVVVAINKDADAPIFSHADYGLVGDLFTIVPELIAALT